MSLLTIFLIAIALSIDACVVSFAHGFILNKNKIKSAFLLASFTGVFQGIMPVLGCFGTGLIQSYIAPASKWIVFAIFMFLGIKFIQESFDKEKKVILELTFSCLILISVATSIDAFAAGISFSLTNTKILFPSILIALITFINSLLGFFCGNYLKKFPTKNLEIFAGLILIFLGLKSLF